MANSLRSLRICSAAHFLAGFLSDLRRSFPDICKLIGKVYEGKYGCADSRNKALGWPSYGQLRNYEKFGPGR